jgi:hypothetical protein
MLVMLYILVCIEIYRPYRSWLLLCWYRCVRSRLLLFIWKFFHPVVPGNNNKYVFITQLRYSFTVYMFTVLYVVVYVPTYIQSRHYWSSHVHCRRRTETGVATVLRHGGGCLTVICTVSRLTSV